MSKVFYKTPGEFKFELARCLVGKVGHGQTWGLRFMKIYSQRLLIRPSCPWVVGNPKKFDFSHNFRIFDHVQSFLQDTWRIQI